MSELACTYYAENDNNNATYKKKVGTFVVLPLETMKLESEKWYLGDEKETTDETNGN